MTSLRQKLIDYIKLHKQVHFRDIEKYAEENGYKAYTAVRRLQEVRDPKDLEHYDSEIGTVEEGGTIKFYVYTPQNGVTNEGRTFQRVLTTEEMNWIVQKESPHHEPPTAPQLKLPWKQQTDFHRPPQTCCSIAILCWEKKMEIRHSGGCKAQKV